MKEQNLAPCVWKKKNQSFVFLSVFLYLAWDSSSAKNNTAYYCQNTYLLFELISEKGFVQEGLGGEGKGFKTHPYL